MSMWDDLPQPLRDSGTLDRVRPLLDDLTGSGPTEVTDDDGTWRVWTADQNLTGPLALDPRTGGFGAGQGSTGTPIELTDPHVTAELGLHLDGAGGSTDGGWRVRVGSASFLVRLPFLRGAMLDPQGQLRADPSKPSVGFVLPTLRLQLKQLSGGAVGFSVLSASTGGPPVDQIYEFIRMDPPYALVGPSDAVGFAFRTAVLDLSGTAGPGVPAGARAMPGDWQGFYLPEARLFVSPNGMEGIAVSAGVRNLWIGIGIHEGVSGVFEAEVVNRGTSPGVDVHFATAAGEPIGDPGVGAAQLPESSTLYVDVHGGLAPITLTISVDGVAHPNVDRVTITTPPAGSVAIIVTATDAALHTTTRTFAATRRTEPVTPGVSGMPVTLTDTSHQTDRMVVASQTATSVTLRLGSGVAADWSWAGGGASNESEATVQVAAGATVSVAATTVAGQQQSLDCYFLFDHPAPDEGHDYSVNPANTHANPSIDRTHPAGVPTFIDDARARRAVVGAATPLTVSGYASYEGVEAQHDHNLHLSERRRSAMIDALTEAGFTALTEGEALGTERAEHPETFDGEPVPDQPGSPGWWRARAVTADPPAAVTVTGDVARGIPPPAVDTDPPPHDPGRPDCFHKLGARVELVRSTFVRCEVYGEFDIETATEQRLAAHGTVPLRSGPRNASDGIVAFLVRLRIAEDQGSWVVNGEFRAAEGDLDGLAEMTDSQSNAVTLNVLGALSILAPLTSSATELSPAAGAVVALGSMALGASDLIHTKRLTLRGAELIVSQGILGADGTTTVSDRGTQVSLLFDLEIAFWFDLTLVRVDPAQPIVTRYKAIGVRSQWGTGAGGALDYVPLPIFDPSRGYSLDIPAGSLSAVPPLDNVLRILGVRVSRDNPTYLEVEVGLGLDLGIITIDTVRVRARVDGPPLDLQLTKFGASIDIANVITGSGEVAFEPGGFSGSFDLQIIPIHVRGSATFTFRRDATGLSGVLLGAEIEFPVPLVLGSSGLGIFGFMFGVGVNHTRIEGTGQVPALDWLRDQLGRPGGVMDGAGWQLHQGGFAFAAGVLVGTLEGGFVVHLKGLVVIEVPGPRLLFVMKADVLKLPPSLGDPNQSATFLAVLDLDFGRGTITIGIVAEYEIEAILKIRIPVTAFFDTNHVPDWFVELGTYQDRVTVEVLDVISGSGYLMIHGNGVSIPVPGFPSVPNGLAIATGFHISAVLMGSKAARLYLEVAGGFDAIVGFDPFFVAGKIYVRGELRLFVVSIGASAELTVMVGKRTIDGVVHDDPYVHGEVCGSVDLFFFEIKGCVSLTIGNEPEDNPAAKPLVAGVSLVSRSPALVEGTATGRAVDAKIGDAVDAAVAAPPPLPVVPLDAIPVISFSTPPRVVANSVLGGQPLGQNGAAANPWTRIGDRWWRYEVASVTLQGPLLPPPPEGKTPSAWWTGAPAGTTVPVTALALLDWLPTPFSRALPYGEQLTTSVVDRWGTVCHPAAPAAPALWTFDGTPTGPSAPGWRLTGIPWPDPPDTIRSAPVEGGVTVTEPWRTGDAVIDLIQGTDPAVVLADAVPCQRGQGGQGAQQLSGLARLGPALAADDPGRPSALASAWSAAPADAALEVLDEGVALVDVQATLASRSWDPAAGDGRLGCRGAILRAPWRDSLDPAPRGSEDDRGEVKAAWSESGFSPHDLRDAVRFTPGTGLVAASFLLLVPERALAGGLVIAAERGDGGILFERDVEPADLVGAAHPLPPAWVDPAGPWADPVIRAGSYAARVRATSTVGHTFVLVDLDRLPDLAASVVIGWREEQLPGRSRARAPFYVVAATGVVGSEGWRQSWDTETSAQDQEALQTALTQDPDDHALFTPNTTYTVDVAWVAAWQKGDTQPGAAELGAVQPSVTQSFRFRTDAATQYPHDLAPWLLTTAPGMDDVGWFCREPVRIAFATQKVGDLYAAYGKQLKVVVRSASGAHPAPPGGAPGSAFVVPLEVGEYLTDATQLTVRTPWEQTVRDLAPITDGMRCIDAVGEWAHHTVLELPYDFEPLTDYLVDVHAAGAGEGLTTENRIHRIGFTTSRFRDLDDLVSFIVPATVRGRLVPTPAGLSALPDRPTGDEVDTAFQAAGLSVPQTPTFPAVDVLWSADAVPQPIALVLESSEPLWRSRRLPTVVTGPVDALDATHQWWKAVPGEWLFLADSSTPVAAGDFSRATITRIIHCPGDTRAIAVLAPGARGQEVRLDLVVAADAVASIPEKRATTVRIALLRAPWEVED